MAKKDKHADLAIEEGELDHGLPYRALGTGEPLVVLRWFSTTHTNPTGWEEKVEINSLAPLGKHFRVYAVNRAPGMAAGTTMAEIAAQHADALRARFGGPVDVLGASSGGSLALQLAADHPDTVRRLVLVGAGHTMGREAREAQRRYTDAAEAGRRGMHHTAAVSFKSALLGKVCAPLMWLADPFMRPRDPSDMVAFARAEIGFDLHDRLGDVTAPTLIISGEKDRSCPPDEVTRETAAALPDADLRVYEGAGHIGAFTSPRFAEDVTAFLAPAVADSK